jgi:phenylpropionate dioxygenase-like ring-hydroxylating dioxygenase large terminal subunit
MKTPFESYPALLAKALPVAFAGEVRTDRPLGVSSPWGPLVLFRDSSGKAKALEDRCPHRNVPLSLGTLEAGCLTCPYHGWRFTAEGVCNHIPGLPAEAAQKQGYSVPIYHATEYDELIWVHLKPDSLDTLDSQRIPKDLTWIKKRLSATGESVNILENLLDATHTHYVHAGLVRREGQRQTVQAEITRSQQQVTVRYTGETGQSGWISGLFEPQRTESFGRFKLPLCGELEYRDAQGTTFFLQAHVVPSHIAPHPAQVLLRVGFRAPWMVPKVLIRLILWPFLRKALQQDLDILAHQTQTINAFGGASFRQTTQDLLRPHMVRILKDNANTPSHQQITLYL